MKRIILLVLGLALVGQDAALAKRERRHHQPEHRYSQPAQPPRSGKRLPACPGSLELNNEQVLRWKESTPNAFKARAFVEGVLVGVIRDRNSHLHLEIDLSDKSTSRTEHLEVIYNKKFGTVPPYRTGMLVQACGDYITANRQNGGYQPSPVGAIIHWIHMSPDTSRHPSGFLAIDGQVTGQTNPNDR